MPEAENVACWPRMPRRAIFTLCCTLLGAASASAHPEIEAALGRLNARIAAAPTEAGAYIERGELYTRHEEWMAAEANFLVAAELAPAHPRLDRARGALALARGEPASARQMLDRAVAVSPADHEARVLRARAAAALGDTAAAARDLAVVLDALPSPPPELILFHVGLLPPAAALVQLEAMMARVGPALVLQLRALELEETTGRVDAALHRLGTLAAQSERPETWIRRRGDLLARHGRTAEARLAYAAALAAALALPDWLRTSPDTRQFIAELRPLVNPST